jgi:hypothetical protein
MVGSAFWDMATCGPRRVTKKIRVEKKIAYPVINGSPYSFPGLKNPPFPENREEGIVSYIIGWEINPIRA